MVHASRADPAHMVIDQVLECRALLLEAGGANVARLLEITWTVEF